MTQSVWSAVDHYLTDLLLPSDPVLDGVLAANQAAGLPAIDVSATQGKFLHLLARIAGAKRILEIGTLGGYSTIWLARALPADGQLTTFEADSHHAAVATHNIEAADLTDRVKIHVGQALDGLETLAASSPPPFDFVFIDADKVNNANYLDWCLKLSHSGTVIVCDNVVRDGKIADQTNIDPSVAGTRRFFEKVATMPGLDATALQTVGKKGYDGFCVVVVE